MLGINTIEITLSRQPSEKGSEPSVQTCVQGKEGIPEQCLSRAKAVGPELAETVEELKTLCGQGGACADRAILRGLQILKLWIGLSYEVLGPLHS